jgi:proline racemase
MVLPASHSLEVIDSHTEGEPTRVVIDGFREPLPGATMAARREHLRRHHDELRRTVVCEPRGHEAMVGALLTPPVEPGSLAGVIFFDNGGYLGMCGHGTIGVVRTLAYLGRLPAAAGNGSGGVAARRTVVRLDTPAGTVTAEVGAAPAAGGGAAPAAGSGRREGDGAAAAVRGGAHERGGSTVAGGGGERDGGGAAAAGDGGERDGEADRDAVTIANVPAHCHARDVALHVPGVGRVIGDIAYGGNWFFVVRVADLDGVAVGLDRLGPLTDLTRRIKAALVAGGITAAAGAEIDHVQLVAPPSGPHADSRNFVLCPGGAYDRSPCGTGTSALLAAMHARGEIAIGRPWRQEGIAGGVFTAWLTRGDGDTLVPHVRGRAYITGRAILLCEPRDPFREGFPAP